jgi:NAD+ kinase
VSAQRIIVVAKRSAYYTQVLVRQDPIYLKLLADDDPLVRGLAHAHEEHEATLERVLRIVRGMGIDHRVIDAPWEPFDVRGVSLVITVGGDGTLLVTSHQLAGDIPILGINSAPSSSVGFFCGLLPDDCEKGIPRALSGGLPSVELSRMEVRLDGRVVSKRVLNDALYCHKSPAATSRYVVEIGSDSEDHKSSGFWIGPPAGSTAAQRSAGGKILPLSSRELQFVVREPYGYTGKLRFSRLLVPDGMNLVAHSKMPDGKLFLDGPHTAFDVGFGMRVGFRRSEESLHVVGLTRRVRRRRRQEPSVTDVAPPRA